MAKRGHDGHGVPQSFLKRQPLPRDRPIQRLAGDILHGDIQLAIRLIDIVNMNNVRVIERRSRLGFLHETPAPIPVGHRLRQQHLERHVAVQVAVAGLVHRAHPAFSQPVHNFEVSDRPADHAVDAVFENIVSRSAHRLPDRLIEHTFGRLIEQRRHLDPQVVVAAARPVEEGALLSARTFQSFVIELFDALPALPVHGDRGDYIRPSRITPPWM